MIKLLYDFYSIHKKKTFSKKLIEFEKYKDDQETIKSTINSFLTDSKYILFVAETDSVLVGFICGEIKEKKHRVYNKEGYIQDWFVDEKFRNKKIGSSLFNTLVNEFKKQDCTHITVDTFVENKKAIDIYHKMRFNDRLLTFYKKI